MFMNKTGKWVYKKVIYNYSNLWIKFRVGELQADDIQQRGPLSRGSGPVPNTNTIKLFCCNW